MSRRLRGVLRPRLESLPQGSLVVVRALPGAAGLRSQALAAEVDAALARLLARADRAAAPRRAGSTPMSVAAPGAASVGRTGRAAQGAPDGGLAAT